MSVFLCNAETWVWVHFRFPLPLLAFLGDYTQPHKAPKCREDGWGLRVLKCYFPVVLCELQEGNSVVKSSDPELADLGSNPCSTLSSLVPWGGMTSLCLSFLLGKRE